MKFVIVSAIAALNLVAAAPVLAQEAEASPPAGPAEIIRTSDTALTCPQIADEAAQLSQQMGGEPSGGLFERLGGVARAGAAMLIPGAGLAMAGADALTAPDRERKAAEALAVEHRWYYLNGLYAGQRCHMAAEAAAPAAMPSPADAAPPAQPAS